MPLTWDAPTDTHTGFRVVYSETSSFVPASEGTVFPNTLAADATGVTVTGLSPGTTYYFRVAAVNSTTAGAYSDEANATTTDGADGSPFSVPGAEGAIRVYPNPTSGKVRFEGLSATRSYRYKVYSLVGQEVSSGRLRSSEGDLSSLSNGGQYILVLEDEEDGEVLRTQLLVLK